MPEPKHIYPYPTSNELRTLLQVSLEYKHKKLYDNERTITRKELDKDISKSSERTNNTNIFLQKPRGMAC